MIWPSSRRSPQPTSPQTRNGTQLLSSPFRQVGPACHLPPPADSSPSYWKRLGFTPLFNSLNLRPFRSLTVPISSRDLLSISPFVLLHETLPGWRNFSPESADARGVHRRFRHDQVTLPPPFGTLALLSTLRYPPNASIPLGTPQTDGIKEGRRRLHHR
jgi:hypothetical protein